MLDVKSFTAPSRYFFFFGNVEAVVAVTLDDVTLVATAETEVGAFRPKDDIHLGINWTMRL